MAMCKLSAGMRRAVAALVVAAVAVLPLIHIAPAQADAGCAGDPAAAAPCCDTPCGTCATATANAADSCCSTEPAPEAPVRPDAPSDPDAPIDNDRPCDCPCCGKVLPAVSMISPLPATAPFWGESPVLLPLLRDARPDSVAMRVDIQPPIV